MASMFRAHVAATVGIAAILIGVGAPLRAEVTPQSMDGVATASAKDARSSEEVLVRFTSQVLERVDRARLQRRSVTPVTVADVVSAPVRTLLNEWEGYDIRPAYPGKFGNPELAARLGLDRTYMITVPAGTDTAAMAADLREHGEDVESAGPSSYGGIAEFIPDDPYYSLQYGMDRISAPYAWDLHTGRQGTVTVAIIDSGVSPHVEFGDRLLPGVNTNAPMICYGGPNDGDTCVDDFLCQPGGYCDFIDNATDELGHGTHVAGIVTAMGNNGEGVAGVHWGANILPVRVTNSSGGGWAYQAAWGLFWAADHGADICNLSLHYYDPLGEYPWLLQDAVDYAHGQGAIVIAAAGNDHDDVVAAPAKYANCVAVSATTSTEEFAAFSNYGPQVEVAAPGDWIWSTVLSDTYAYKSGTSMAAPHVSGLAALIKSYAYYLTNDEIRTILSSTAEDLGDTGWDQFFGNGRIDAFAALSAVDPAMAMVSSWPPDGAIDARQPSAPDGSAVAGWESIEIDFDDDPVDLTVDDFTVTVDPAGTSPGITSVTPVGNTVTLELDSIIPVEAWTTITHNDSGTSTTFGFLPADVNGDGLSNTSDILTLIDALNGVGDPLEEWSVDINRSGLATPQDILREIDLLNGAGVYSSYVGASLP